MSTFIHHLKKKTNRVLLATLAISLLLSVPHAQPAATTQQSSEDRGALYQALLDLTNPWTVMCVAAHPDDEDGTSLIVMRRKYGAHTVSLFSTFGEGGQNAIGPELYEELGAIRARETMAAAEIQGSEPHFLGLKDFGYSKTRDEAFKFWGHEEALRRMVLEIRKLRPDVIITNHSTTSNDHGQHQATALMVVEAFDAAADPNKFPEQLKDSVTTWQVQRLFVRARGNQASAADAQIVTIDPNERDPIRGVVYAEEALRALQKHATQGPWPKTFAEYANRFRAFSGQQGGAAGQLPMIRYALVREAKGATALPKDSHNFLNGLRLPESIADAFQLATNSLPRLADDRARTLAALIKLRQLATKDAAVRELMFRDQKLDRALSVATGLSAKLIVEQNPLPLGDNARVTVQLLNNGDTPARVQTLELGAGLPGSIYFLPWPRKLEETLLPGQTLSRSIDYPTGPTTGLSGSSVPHDEHLYDGRFSGYALSAIARVRVGDELFNIGNESRIDVAPPVEIQSIVPSNVVIIPSTRNQPITFNVRVTNHHATPFKGMLSVQNETFKITLPARTSKDVETSLSRGIDVNTSVLRFGVSGSAAVNRFVPVAFSNALVAPDLRVGYIRGFDFSLPNALASLGVQSTELTVDEVKSADLSKFTSIIVDNRVYESKPELIAANQKLLDYANAGGNLIVFYHKSDEWNPDPRRNRPQLAPYKLILGNERITDENAPITFIEPDHPLLNTPNKLNQDDFKDWIQERGLYYPREWDPQFHALLESRDFNEPSLKGGLLVADYGRGHYIYTSMVWYRELRGGIPGAYRMLANMISYGRK